MIKYLGLWLILAVAFNVWAFLSVLGSGSRFPTIVLWAAVLLVPVVGFVLWYLLGPRQKPA